MNFLKNGGFQKLLALGALVILWVFFAIFGKNFVSSATTLNILAASYYVGFLALGVTFVIITGGIDLSIGAVMMCSALIGGECYRNGHVPLAYCIFIIIAVGTFFGYINGLLVTKLKLPPFIATLGTMMVALGLGSIVTNTTSKYFPTISEPGGWFVKLFYKTENGFPMGAIFLLVFYILAMIVLNKTKLGRYIYAIGSNEEATRLSGININLIKTTAYIICGFFAGLAAIFYAATYTVVIPNTGNGMELLAIAGVVIGGTSLSGGVGSLTGTIIGVFIMSVLKNGLVSIGLPAPYQVLFTGIVVIVAVLFDVYRNNTNKNSKAVKFISRFLIIAVVVTLLAVGGYTYIQKIYYNNNVYVSVVTRSFGSKYWQSLVDGAEKAGKELGIKVYCSGPDGDNDLAPQLDIIKQELAKKPSAMVIGPVKLDAMADVVKQANKEKVPIVIVDSGKAKIKGCKLSGTASTDNYLATTEDAKHLYNEIKGKIDIKGHVVVGVIAQDQTSSAIIERVTGFTEILYDIVVKDGYSCAVSGDFKKLNKGDENNCQVLIKIFQSTSSNLSDVSNISNNVLKTKNLVGVFCSNETAVNGFLATLNAGAQLGDVIVVGFDTSSSEKAAVRDGVFLGAVAQNPYKMGYEGVKLAYEATKKKPYKHVDTGAIWYDKKNVDDSKLKDVLYD